MRAGIRICEEDGDGVPPPHACALPKTSKNATWSCKMPTNSSHLHILIWTEGEIITTSCLTISQPLTTSPRKRTDITGITPYMISQFKFHTLLSEPTTSSYRWPLLPSKQLAHHHCMLGCRHPGCNILHLAHRFLGSLLNIYWRFVSLSWIFIHPTIHRSIGT